MEQVEKNKLRTTFTYNSINAFLKLMEKFPSQDRKSQRVKDGLQHKAKKLKNFIVSR